MKTKTFTKEFQRHVVSCAIQDHEFAARFLPALEPAYFDDPDLQDVITYSQQYFRKNNEVPSRPLLVELLEKPDEVKRLYRKVRDIKSVSDRVLAFCRKQALKEAVIRCARMVEKGDLDRLEKIIQQAQAVGASTEDLGEFLVRDQDKRVAEYLHPEQAAQSKIPTGMTYLDQCLGGGLEEGELGVVMGSSKSGKSMFLANIAFGAASGSRGLEVVYYSLEMRQRKILRRIDRRIAGGRFVQNHETHPKRFVRGLTQRTANMMRGDILVKSYPTKTATLSTFRSHLKKLHLIDFKPRLIVVDYGDIMKPEEKYTEVRHSQESCFVDMRTLAGEAKACVWSGTQCNRKAVSKKTLDMEDVAEAYSKVQVSDAFTAICRTPEEKLCGTARLHLCAMRDTKTNVIIDCVCQFEHTLFRTVGIRKVSAQDFSDDKKIKKKEAPRNEPFGE